MFEKFERLVGHASEPVANVVEEGAVREFAEAIGDPNPVNARRGEDVVASGSVEFVVVGGAG